MQPLRLATLALLGLTALVSACAISITEADFLRPGKTVWPPATVDGSFRREVVSVTHADGNVSRGMHLHSPRARGTVLFFQGNGELLDREGAQRLWHFERLNLNAYIFDRRGFGQTRGTPTVALLASDALDLFDTVRQRETGPLLVHGFSIGSSIAAQVARQRPVDALVIEGGSPSVQAYVDAHMPWYLAPFARFKVAPELARTDTRDALAGYTGPVLVAVGAKDPDTVPALSQALFDELKSPAKELAIVPDAPHHALITPAGWAVYAAFVDKVFR